MITPAFALDFTSATIDPRITFARSLNTATRVNGSGYIEAVNADLPRFDYNPITLVCSGLLIEELRTNGIIYSSDISNANWTRSGLTIAAPSITSPDNATNGAKVTESNLSEIHLFRSAQRTGLSTGTDYTYSIFLKANERRYVNLSGYAAAGLYAAAVFDLQDGVITATGASNYTLTGSKITAFRDGWYRCTITFRLNTGTAAYVGVGLSNVSTLSSGNFGFNTYLGDGTSSIYGFGGQFETGAFATSYIPTTTTALTRNADVATITGTNFSGWWNAGFGGATVQALPSTVSGIRPLIQFDDGTANEIIAMRGNTTNPELYIVDGGAPQAQIDAGTIAANTAYSLTGWWQTNFCAARKDNGARVEDLTATIPTVTQARLGSDGTNYLNGHLATIDYYDQFSGQIYTRRKNKAVFNVI